MAAKKGNLDVQVMGPADFVRLLEAVLIVSGRCLGHAARVRDLVLDFLGGTKAPRALQSEAAQGCADAITAVSEAAHACWIRLLNARCVLYSKLSTLWRLTGFCGAMGQSQQCLPWLESHISPMLPQRPPAG